MLAVVNHKQHVAPTQVLQDRLRNRLPRTLVDSERRPKHSGNRIAIFDLRQVYQTDSARICMQSPVSHFQRQPGLARAPDSGKSHEALRCEETLELGQLIPTTDKRRQLQGEIVSTPVR